MKDYNQYYNKGNDCDICQNQYICGRDGDRLGCKMIDLGLPCNFKVDENLISIFEEEMLID